MADHQVARHWDPERSKPGHNLLLVSSSGDNDVEAGLADGTCGWLGPNIKPPHRHDKHVTDAFDRHIADVEQNGPLVHGRAGEDRCRCYFCRHGQTPAEMHGQGSTGSAPYSSESGDAL